MLGLDLAFPFLFLRLAIVVIVSEILSDLFTKRFSEIFTFFYLQILLNIDLKSKNLQEGETFKGPTYPSNLAFLGAIEAKRQGRS